MGYVLVGMFVTNQTCQSSIPCLSLFLISTKSNLVIRNFYGSIKFLGLITRPND
ncbi:hypothetical protein HanRHA438_Chr10g0467471 [Helianthus annuus]|nr:hypothetical protein HanRHA438_Chr10g0467471 [Helianthus annuus]